MFINDIYTTVRRTEQGTVQNDWFKCNLCLEINSQMLQQDDD